MNKLCKRGYGLCVIVMGLGMSGLALGATGTGPYYATPSWDQKLTAASRFIVLTDWSSQAVLDRETGLVWEQSPSTTGDTWYNQSFHCINLNTGGRTGWRLPTVQELLSLVDRTQTNPSLPSGHPFTVQSFFYWSASTFAFNATDAWGVYFGNGGVFNVDKSLNILAWCVRGGPAVDPQ